MNELELMIEQIRDDKKAEELINKMNDNRRIVQDYTTNYFNNPRQPVDLLQHSTRRIEKDLPAKFEATLYAKLKEEISHELNKQKIRDKELDPDIKALLLKSENIRHEKTFALERPEKVMEGNKEILSKGQVTDIKLEASAQKMLGKMENETEEALAKLEAMKKKEKEHEKGFDPELNP